MLNNNSWQELVLEVLRAAREGLSINDFTVRCQLAPIEIGKSYQDRLRVADKLLSDGTIFLDDGFMRIGLKDSPVWLTEDLKQGLDVAWDILTVIDPSQKLGNKFDRLFNEELGYDGEMAVIAELHSRLHESVHHRIHHVSLIDDSAGFDIRSPSALDPSESLLLEVKTTSRPGEQFSFFISRNEARVGSLNANWRLIGVIKDPHGFSILGSLSFMQISSFLPIDQVENGRWESAKISIPRSTFLENLP